MGGKDLLLPLARALVIKVVEASLADTDDLRVFGKLNQPGDINIRLVLSLMGMNAVGAADIVMSRGDRQDLVELGHARADGQHAFDTILLGTGQDGFHVAAEVIEVEVAVAIDQGDAHDLASSGST